MERGKLYGAILVLFLTLNRVSSSWSGSFLDYEDIDGSSVTSSRSSSILDDEDIEGSSGLGLGVQPVPSSEVTYKEIGNITLNCTHSSDQSCSGNTSWWPCLSRIIENQPGCSVYNYYTVESIQHDCNSARTSCALSTTIIRATRPRNDTTWQCSSTKYDVDSITPSSDIHVNFSPRPSVDVESNIRIVKALHQSATLSISVLAYPTPIFDWFMARSSTEWINVTYGVVSDDKQSHLYFDSLEQDDFGQYKVEIRNSIKPDYVQLFTIQEGDNKPSLGHPLGAVIGAGCGGLTAGILAMLLVLLICRIKRQRKGRDVRSYDTTGSEGREARSYDTAGPQVTNDSHGRSAKSAENELEMETYENTDVVQGKCVSLQRDGNFEVMDPLRTCREPSHRSKVLSYNGDEIYDEIL